MASDYLADPILKCVMASELVIGPPKKCLQILHRKSA